MMTYKINKEIDIPVDSVSVFGDLIVPDNARAIIVFAHGSGSSRHSSRNKYVAETLREAGFATLLFDLLTKQEDEDYAKRFEIILLGERLLGVSEWLQTEPETANLSLGYFGASTGAAAALEAAAILGKKIKAVVSRGGRPDMASNLALVTAPTLLIAGSMDKVVIQLNKEAFSLLKSEKELRIIEGASHLFEEPGKLEEVAKHATAWFSKYLKAGKLS